MIGQLEVNGISYAFEMEGEGEPLVLLHGFAGSSAMWSPFLPYLGQDFLILTIDILGHGRTRSPADPQRYSMEQVAEDITAVVQHLIQEPAHLLGYSMGGRLALYLALSQPTLWRSLVLESSTAGLASPEARSARQAQDAKLAERIQREGVPAFVEFWQDVPIFASQKNLPTEAWQRQKRQRLQNNPLGLAHSLLGMGTGSQPNLWPRLAELHVPTFLLAGALDEKYVAIVGQLGEQIAGAQTAVLPDVGHNTHLEAPSQFYDLITDFMLNVEPL